MRLLFVDDDPPILRAMERMMRAHRREWECHFASDPLEALETLTAVAPDVIVSDMLMPGLDGVEFLDEAARRRPTAARFILSGEVGAGAVVRMARSAHQCLTKPCRGDVLLGVVRQAVVGGQATTLPAVREGLYRLTSLPVAAPRILALRRALALRDDHARDATAIALIERCAGLAAKLLQVATWTQVGLGPAPRHVRDAYAMLGADAVSALMDAGVVAVIPNGRTTSVQVAAWQRAETAATLASTLAADAGLSADDAAEAALVALWAASAPLLLESVAPDRYPALRAAAIADDRAMAAAERSAFGLDATTALAQMLRLWGLPDRLWRAVGSVGTALADDTRTADGIAHLAYASTQTSGDTRPAPDASANADRLGLTARVPTWRAPSAAAAVSQGHDA